MWGKTAFPTALKRANGCVGAAALHAQHSAHSAAVPLPSDGRPQAKATMLLRYTRDACEGLHSSNTTQSRFQEQRKGFSIKCYYFAQEFVCGTYSTFVRFQMVIGTHRQKALKKCINFAI
jgi:hypothetical protein